MPLTTEEVSAGQRGDGDSRGCHGHSHGGGCGWGSRSQSSAAPGDRVLPWEGRGDPFAVPSWHGLCWARDVPCEG